MKCFRTIDTGLLSNFVHNEEFDPEMLPVEDEDLSHDDGIDLE